MPEPADRTRFERVVLTHLDAAHNLARWLMRDADGAADAVQDACLRAYRAFDTLRGDDARAWLLAIVRNVCFSALARGGTLAAETPFDEEIHVVEDAASDPESVMVRASDGERVRSAVEALPLESREVIVLREIEGLSYGEIARALGVPIGTVMSRLARARARLRAALAEGPRRPAEAPQRKVRP